MELLLVLVGGLLATIGGFVSEIYRNRWVNEREREARQAALKERLDDIQRETLLELQQRLAEWMHAVGIAHILAGIDPASESAAWLDASDVDELSRRAATPSHGAVEAGRRVRYLGERVRDDELRQLLATMRTRITLVQSGGGTMPQDQPDVFRQAAIDLLRSVGDVQDRLGVVLRAYL